MSQLSGAVTEAVCEALCLEEGEVESNSSIIDDLGAESIDLLDILFRIERKVGVKVKVTDLADYIQGGISDEEFANEQEIITDNGLAHLQSIMPQINAAEMSGKLPARQIMNLFTVDNLAGMVEARRSGHV